MGHPRAYAGYSLHTRRRSFLYFIYAPLRQIAGMGWCCMGGCSWVFLSGVYGAYRLGWDVVKWPGEKKREGCAVAVAEGSGHQCLTILCFNF